MADLGERVVLGEEGDGRALRADAHPERGLEAARARLHRVTVPASYYEKLTGRCVAVEELVRLSFEFLLEREPKESILRTFELPVIGRYFPEFEREITRRLGARAG